MIAKVLIKDYRKSDRILFGGTDFIYLLPHPELRGRISNYTITFPGKGMMSDDYAVIPHGSATLVFSCDENRISGNLFGPITKPARVGQHANLFTMLFIVEFQPAGFYAFSGMPQKELTNCLLPFDTVNPAMDRLLKEKLESALDVEGLIAEMDRLFLRHLKTIFYQQEFLLINQKILQSGGLVTVKELSQNAFYSERHLGRVFEKYMGLNIKSFSRLVRVNKSIRLLQRRDYSLMHACLETGFYDMPHFIHEFKSICGITPQQYRNNMSDFYSEIAKF